MTVPTTGNFLMFGSGDNTTIAGAIIQGGANLETVSATTNFNALKGLADISKFDTNYSEGASTLAAVTKASQFRGYPIAVTTTVDCYVYEYINNTATTISFGPYTLCDGLGSYSIEIGPSAEGATFCLEQLSQSTIDAFSSMGLILTQAASICNLGSSPSNAIVINCGTTFTSTLFEPWRKVYRIPLGTQIGTSDYQLDVPPASGAGTTGAHRFVITYNNLTVVDTGWISRDPNANSVYLTGLNNVLTNKGLPTVSSITVVSGQVTGTINKNQSSVQDAFIEVYTFTPNSSTGNPYAYIIDCVSPTTTTSTTTTTTTTAPTTTTTTTVATTTTTTRVVITTTAAPVCYVYEYINNSGNTINVNGTLCGGGSYSLPVTPGGEGATFCLQQLSQATIDAYASQGLILTQAFNSCT